MVWISGGKKDRQTLKTDAAHLSCSVDQTDGSSGEVSQPLTGRAAMIPEVREGWV